MGDPNIELLLRMARALEPVLDQLVFVGGCATSLLLTAPSVTEVRATEDVDAIVEVVTLSGYHKLTRELMKLGFSQSMEEGTPAFRWHWRGMQLDLMPMEARVMGFASRWYRPGFAAAEVSRPPGGLRLRHLSAPYFLATKLEAFNDRGNNDVYLSHDLEDVITLIDGRQELLAEFAASPGDLRSFVASTLENVLRNADFLNVLPGIVSQPMRSGLVLDRLEQLVLLE